MDDEYIDDNAPDVIASIYKSMSQIIEALNTDNVMLNQQIKKLRNELDFVCTSFIELKAHADELTKKIEALSDLKKYMIDTRTALMQALDANNKNIKKELSMLEEKIDAKYSTG